MNGAGPQRRDGPWRIASPILVGVVTLVFVALAWAPGARAQGSRPPLDIPLLRADAPGETVATFAQLRDSLEATVLAYRAAPTRAGLTKINLILSNLRGLIDLDDVPPANRHRVGNATALALLDVFGRVPLPDPDDMPSAEDFDATETATIRLPDTPLGIARVDAGSRIGEWLFAAASVTAAPRFLSGIWDTPLRSGIGWDSWGDGLPQLTGPLVPDGLAGAIPAPLQAAWQGLPIWKAALLAIAAGLSALLLAGVDRWSTRTRRRWGRGATLLRVLTPILALVILQGLLPGLARELMPFSQMPDLVAHAFTLMAFAVLAWLFWSAMQALVGLRIEAAREADRPVDGDLLRLVGAALGGLGVVVILTTGAHRLGIPVVSLAAGLGIGGLAVALAVRPTLENLVGGLLLYLDRPVRIGDFCTFGDKSGTVERIGVRAVWIRALDRTLISIPNARFADMELINWAACDMMLINRVLRLRLETSPDQLRYVLAEIRKMLHAHPRIDDDTVRIRYLGPGDTAREIDLRFYVRTREWNEFFAIREDAFFRIDEIVSDAGAQNAVPVQVLHLSRDAGGAEPSKRLAAEDQVAAWRKAGRLPFPKFSRDELDALDDTLDYPPTGSPDAGTEGHYRAATPEELSQAPDTDPHRRPPPSADGRST